MTYQQLVKDVPPEFVGQGWFITPDPDARLKIPVFVRCPTCHEGLALYPENRNLIVVGRRMHVCVNHRACQHQVYQLTGWKPQHTELILHVPIIRLGVNPLWPYRPLPGS